MDPAENKKLLSQEQGFHEGRTDEHKSLPHFSFILFKFDVVLDFWNLRVPLVVRIHLNLSQPQLVSCSFLFYVTAHCRQQCPSRTPCSLKTFFLRGYDPSLTPGNLSVSLSLSLHQQMYMHGKVSKSSAACKCGKLCSKVFQLLSLREHKLSRADLENNLGHN